MPTTREHTGRGRKLVGARKYSSRPRRRLLPTRGAMRKTTAKGAYSKVPKKAMMIRRAPFVETKSRTHEDVLVDFPSLTARNVFTAYNTGHLNMNPDSFLALQQGLEENQMVGRSIFAKFLKMKITIRFPQPAFLVNGKNQIIPQVPQRYQLIWGFVNSTNWTGNTTPPAPNATLQDVHNWINQRVVDYMNEQKDFLRFIPKKSSTLTIIGRRKVYPSKKYLQAVTSHDNLTTDTITGTIPDFNTSLYWPMKRKIHYEKTNDLENNQQSSPGFYPNYNRLPFCVLWNPDYEDLPSVDRYLYCPQVAYNDCMWFSDS